ncbi:FAD:protein FMN transferase [Parvularcula sp. LCG005]|uniref:FAD:protein FMN transferase n=1 Tax=Parvularcula sp. LCG005 TaxID=3078805 RepID=UPI0029425FE1|nr:FAD:protein FMN transferase [Parvularcula sp. LCG005]WOI52339.1 FAD:protein FMN transferase [Parvularcula sp. LCG005]
MGTNWSAHFVSDVALEGPLRAGFEAMFDDLIALCSAWSESSWLSRFNGSPSGSSREVPPSVVRLLDMAKIVHGQSRGAFDPGLGAEVARRGFVPPPSGLATASPSAPTEGGLLAAYDGRTLIKQSGYDLDLNAIAKGYAVDRMADVMRLQGIEHGLVEIGGEYVGRGFKPDRSPWIVRLEPVHAEGAIVDVALMGLTLATSGDTARQVVVDGHTLSHIVTQASTVPEPSGGSVTVIHETCAMADAWATALFAAGTEQGLSLANENNLGAIFLRQGHEPVLSSRAESWLA